MSRCIQLPSFPRWLHGERTDFARPNLLQSQSWCCDLIGRDDHGCVNCNLYNIYIYIIYILWISMIIYDYVVILWYIQIMDMYGLWYVWLCDDMCTNVRICANIYIYHVWFDWIWLNDVFPCHNLIVDVQLCISPEHVLRSPCILSRPMDDPGVYMAPIGTLPSVAPGSALAASCWSA